MQKKILKKTLILASCSFIFSSLFFLSGIWNLFELKVYDLLSIYVSSNKKYDNICLIYVDQSSIEALGKQGIVWPWPRQIYAPVIEYLSEADAVFLDILFTEYSSYGVEDDKILAEAIKKAGNVYLPVVVSKEKREFDEEYVKKIDYSNQIPVYEEYNSVIFPIDDFKRAAKGLGNVSILPDEDGIYRRMPLFFKVKEYLIPNFTVSYFIQKNVFQVKSEDISTEGKKIPLIKGKLLLKYSKEKNPFSVFSFLELIEASTLKDNKSKIKKEFFKDKTVFIGFTAAGLFDLKPTPVSSKTPGVFIHAIAYENLVNKNFIKTTPNFLSYIIIFLISLLIPCIFLKQHYLKVNLFVFLLVGLFLISIVSILFKFSIYFHFLPSFTCLMFSSIVTLLYSYATEGKQRSFIKRTFMQYMDKRIVDYLLEHPESIAPGGRRETVTVFFADIEGFTTLSERLSAEDTAIMLHSALNSMTEVVIKHSGVIDKYIGDCIMAFWGAPLKTDGDETNACNAAIECIKSVEETSKQFLEKGLSALKIRIGIHTGDAVVGNIGSDRLFNYTVIGDTVNIASRLESANKFFRTRIIISEVTFSKISDDFIARELGFIKVKGRDKPLRIYEILGKRMDENSAAWLLTEKFKTAYSLYKEKKWNEAREIFKAILKELPEDFPSRLYLNFIEKYSKMEQLTEDWFIVKIEEK